MGEKQRRGREMLPLYVHFCVVALPWARERGLITLEMSCVSLNGEGSSFVASSNAELHHCILSLEVARVHRNINKIAYICICV